MKQTMDVVVARGWAGWLSAWTGNFDCYTLPLPRDWFPEITKDSEPIPMTLTLEEKGAKNALT